MVTDRIDRSPVSLVSFNLSTLTPSGHAPGPQLSLATRLGAWKAFRMPLTQPFVMATNQTLDKYRSKRITAGWKTSSNHVHRCDVSAGSLLRSEDHTHNQTGKLTMRKGT